MSDLRQTICSKAVCGKAICGRAVCGRAIRVCTKRNRKRAFTGAWEHLVNAFLFLFPPGRSVRLIPKSQYTNRMPAAPQIAREWASFAAAPQPMPVNSPDNLSRCGISLYADFSPVPSNWFRIVWPLWDTATSLPSEVIPVPGSQQKQPLESYSTLAYFRIRPADAEEMSSRYSSSASSSTRAKSSRLQPYNSAIA